MDWKFIGGIAVAFVVTFAVFYWIIYPSIFSAKIDDSTRARYACILLCKTYRNNGTDLSKGPCLSENIIPDWVCDVAHSPRQAVDNMKENQCPEYGRSAHHLVEVTPDCELIRTV